jgi:rsbT antagonist protein RsbS
MTHAYLLVTIQVDMHDRLAMALQDDLTSKIVSAHAKGVLIDISALEMVDSFIGRMFGDIAAMSRVLDAETVVVGMRPAVAITLVELGLSLSSFAPSSSREETMLVPLSENRSISTPEDVVAVRQAVRQRAVELGFNLVDQTKIVTAASELARNTLQHGGGGTSRIEEVLRG